MHIVTKPWGKEEWLELNDRYCYKRIYINSGYKTSYQYHNLKRETNYIISGEAEIWLENDAGVVEKKIMKAGEYFNVSPTKKHRVIALSDLILQEVSTPEVDDVVRLEDDTNRKDGKIEGEHKSPAVLILAAGLGKRLGNLTKNINKGLIPINNRAIISYIIEKFPNDYDFIIATGYKSDTLKAYCKIVFPYHKFTFIDVPNYDEKDAGPGLSALMCKEYLQRPFYITTCDCLISDTIPYLDGNWLGISDTCFPEKYSTVKVSGDIIKKVVNKSLEGFDFAFIGLASIWDYDIFWNELETKIEHGELMSAFYDIEKYPIFRAKKIDWFDTGNLDDLQKAKQNLGDTKLSLEKNNSEIIYKENNKIIKFSSDIIHQQNKLIRANSFQNLVPNNLKLESNLLVYDWIDGNTLYELNSFEIFCKFLEYIKPNFKDVHFTKENQSHITEFYKTKTFKRVDKFLELYGNSYYDTQFSINNKEYPSMKDCLNRIRIEDFYDNPFYKWFHGDMQFDNIVFSHKEDKFFYIDWRESFSGNVNSGDIYYDLAKLYGGLLIPYNKMKDDNNIHLVEGEYSKIFNIEVSNELIKFREFYEKWIISNNFDLNKIKIITALIFINMSPLHTGKFSKLLWYMGIKTLSDNSYDK